MLTIDFFCVCRQTIEQTRMLKNDDDEKNLMMYVCEIIRFEHFWTCVKHF